MSYINARVGVHFEADHAAKLLTKMCLDTEVVAGADKLCVSGTEQTVDLLIRLRFTGPPAPIAARMRSTPRKPWVCCSINSVKDL